MMRTRHWLIKRLLPLLLVCGAPVPLSAAVEVGPPATVVLQLKRLHQFQFAGFYAAVEQGFYREAGLNVVLKEARPGLDMIGELLAGHADYLVNSPSVVLARAEGRPVVALAAIFQHSPLVLVSRQDARITTPADLVGRRVMLTPETESQLVAMALHQGLTLDQLHILPHSWDLDDLIAGRTDAMSAYLTDAPFVLERRGVPFNLLQPLTYDIDFYGDILYTTARETEQHPERVEAFLEASLRGWAYAMDHPEEIIELILTRYGSRLSREELRFEAAAMHELILPQLVELGHMSKARWQEIVRTYIELGLLPAGFSLEGFLYQPGESPFWTARKLHWLLVTLGLTGGTVLVLLLFNHRLRAAVQKRTEQLSTANRELRAESAERQKSNEALRESEQRFRTLVGNIPGVVYRRAFDSDGTIYFISNEIETVSGYPAADFIRTRTRTFASIIDPDDRPMVAGVVAESVGQQRPYTLEYRIRHADGSTRWIYDKGQAAFARDGEALHLDGVIIDYTEQKRAEQALLQLDRMKNEFISTAAHELRTPLTSVIGYSELLLGADLASGMSPELQREFLQEIHAKGIILAKLIDELLDIGRIESGQPLMLNRQACDLEPLVRKVVRHYRLCAPGHRFQIELAPVEAGRLQVDHNRIVQVLENLISNAVKYSAKGSLVRVEGEAGATDYRVSIVDEGVGMTPEQVERVFDKFFRADMSNTAIGGLGLGMSIVRQIVLAHAGEIEVRSVPRKGTRVTVALPLQRPPESTSVQTAATDRQP